jgi:hypothetical protein
VWGWGIDWTLLLFGPTPGVTMTQHWMQIPRRFHGQKQLFSSYMSSWDLSQANRFEFGRNALRVRSENYVCKMVFFNYNATYTV